MGFLKGLWEAIVAVFHRSQYDPPLPEPIPEPMPPTPDPRLEIYDFAKSCLGKDIAATQNELGCAEAISYIFQQLQVQGFPKTAILSTAGFWAWLKESPHFEEVSQPLPGDVIISPTGTSTKGAAHGHIGIVAYYGILSNNSMNGLFQETYTDQSWNAYYHDKLGFPVRYYRYLG